MIHSQGTDKGKRFGMTRALARHQGLSLGSFAAQRVGGLENMSKDHQRPVQTEEFSLWHTPQATGPWPASERDLNRDAVMYSCRKGRKASCTGLQREKG